MQPCTGFVFPIIYETQFLTFTRQCEPGYNTNQFVIAGVNAILVWDDQIILVMKDAD